LSQNEHQLFIFQSSCLPPPSFCKLSVSLVLLLRLVFTREQLCCLVLRILCGSHCSEKFSALSDTAGANLKSSTGSENYLVLLQRANWCSYIRSMQSRGDCSQMLHQIWQQATYLPLPKDSPPATSFCQNERW